MDPVEIEATPDEDTVAVDYGPNTYTLPASLEDCSGDVLEAVEDQKLSRALKGLLGTEQWAAFKLTEPKVRDYRGLFDAYAACIGLTLGG